MTHAEGGAVREAVRAFTSYLEANPAAGRITDVAASATLVDDVGCQVTGPRGWQLTTDMPRQLGGEASAALPSWVLRAAVASCTTTTIAMRAAELCIALSELTVEVDGETDIRGFLAVYEDAPVPPLEVRVRVSISGDASAERLRDLVDWSLARSTVTQAIAQSVKTSFEVITNSPGSAGPGQAPDTVLVGDPEESTVDKTQ